MPPIAYVGFIVLLGFVAAIGLVLYLRKREDRLNEVARAAATHLKLDFRADDSGPTISGSWQGVRLSFRSLCEWSNTSERAEFQDPNVARLGDTAAYSWHCNAVIDAGLPDLFMQLDPSKLGGRKLDPYDIPDSLGLDDICRMRFAATGRTKALLRDRNVRGAILHVMAKYPALVIRRQDAAIQLSSMPGSIEEITDPLMAVAMVAKAFHDASARISEAGS